ncbi:MBL fold metallo-hydrolase [Mucilaginibacter gynuensis]|uniref:MBL fold metallo-hydrolase n=2 Tax=Mucilaginibacter gynuensis TaxID=1302236 RepID=A0ABP8HLA9_9SPHI
MFINQFYDKGLAHASYAVIRAGKMIVIDPARDPQPYYDLATLHEADIVGVIETHLHADFVSSHLEIHQTTGATVYVSKVAHVDYPHETFDDGDVISLVDIKLKAINTPGHSPDSICILVEDENGRDTTIFTGDTLFVGDVGRPDLRETAGNVTAKKEELAKQMYHSTREKLMKLTTDVVVYPAHGPGSLCGKNMSPDLQSTIGRELRENYALQLMDELKFVNLLIADQPFVPRYFGFDVETNKAGASAFNAGVEGITHTATIEKGALVIDNRPKKDFVQGHIKGAINLQDGEKFETWLGSILNADEQFYLIGADREALDIAIKKAAKIGYEKNIKAALNNVDGQTQTSPELNFEDFKENPDNYTIIDVRNHSEIAKGKLFKNAIPIPLPELRDRLNEIPTGKPIVVHCAAGYRSAAGSSIIEGAITQVPVYDLSERINGFAVKK